MRGPRKPTVAPGRKAWEAAIAARSAPGGAQHLEEAKAKGKPLVPARKTLYAGVLYDSGFEARIAEQLDWLARAGEISGIERQYKLELLPYTAQGLPVTALRKFHRVDFRVRRKDGRYALVEAKGYATPAYKGLAKWIRFFWLPAHPDHDYVVVYQGDSLAALLALGHGGL